MAGLFVADAQAPKRNRKGDGRWALGVAALAALLASLPEARRPGFYFQDDMQSQYVPLFRELAQGWARGELPIITHRAWSGGAIAGEYQHGSFSLLHVLLGIATVVARLEPPGMALWLTLAYVALTAGGAFLLARHYAVGKVLAVGVALATALNGFNVYWSSWLPALTGFAWVPWLWWAAARCLRGERRLDRVLLAFFCYGLLAAGWHFALLMSALLLTYLLLFERGRRSLAGALLRLAPALATGALLSAPALLCFVEYALASTRSDLAVRSWAWTAPPSAILGLFLPRSLGTWRAFGTSELIPNVVMSGGSLWLLVLPAALMRERGAARALAPLLSLCALVLLLAATPNLGSSRWPFRWLPLLHLAVALLAARAVQPWAESTACPRGWRTSAVIWSLPVLLLCLLVQPSSFELLVNASLVALCVAAWTWAEGLPARLPRVLTVGVVANLVFTPLSGPPRTVTPLWRPAACFPGGEGRGLRQLSIVLDAQLVGTYRVHDEQQLSSGSCFFPGSSGLLYDRPTASGYSLLFQRGLAEILALGVHGDIGVDAARAVLGPWSEPGSLLDRWGVEALTVSSHWHTALDHKGWQVAASSDDVQLLRRTPEHRTRTPLVSVWHAGSYAHTIAEARERLLQDGRASVYVPDQPEQARSTEAATASVRLLAATDNGVSAHVVVARGQAPALVQVLRPYLPGYRATLNDHPLALGRADGAFLVAEVPAGASGLLRFEYRPLGVRWPGLLAFALGCAGLVLLALAQSRAAQRLQKPS